MDLTKGARSSRWACGPTCHPVESRGAEGRRRDWAPSSPPPSKQLHSLQLTLEAPSPHPPQGKDAGLLALSDSHALENCPLLSWDLQDAIKPAVWDWQGPGRPPTPRRGPLQPSLPPPAPLHGPQGGSLEAPGRPALARLPAAWTPAPLTWACLPSLQAASLVLFFCFLCSRVSPARANLGSLNHLLSRR